MTIQLVRCFITAGLFLLLSILPAQAAQQVTFVRIAAINSAIAQISSAVLQKAYARIHIVAKVDLFPPERAIQLSNSGAYDGEAHRIPGIEKNYPNLIRVDVPIADVRGCVFSKTVVPKEVSWKGIMNYHVGYWHGVKFIERKLTSPRAVRFYNQEAMLSAVQNGAVELGVSACRSGNAVLKKLNITEVKALPDPIEIIPLYHYVHKDKKALIPLLEKELTKMQQDGSLKAIVDRIDRQLLEEQRE